MALNKPFTDSHSRGTKQPCWRGRDALEWDKQSKLPFYMGHFPFNQNFRKFGNSGNGTEISGKVSGNSWNCWISEMRTIQPKILEFWEQSWMERKLPGKHFRKFGYTSRGFALFWKFWKMLFHSLLEVAKNFKPDVFVEWKAPTMYMYPWLFCTMTNCKGPINSHQCNLTLWIVELWYADYTLAIIKNVTVTESHKRKSSQE